MRNVFYWYLGSVCFDPQIPVISQQDNCIEGVARTRGAEFSVKTESGLENEVIVSGLRECVCVCVSKTESLHAVCLCV